MYVSKIVSWFKEKTNNNNLAHGYSKKNYDSRKNEWNLENADIDKAIGTLYQSSREPWAQVLCFF